MSGFGCHDGIQEGLDSRLVLDYLGFHVLDLALLVLHLLIDLCQFIVQWHQRVLGYLQLALHFRLRVLNLF